MDRFNEFKKIILERVKKVEDCEDAYKWAERSNTFEELMQFVACNFSYACEHKIIDGVLIDQYKKEFNEASIFHNEDVTDGWMLADGDSAVRAWGKSRVCAFGDSRVEARSESVVFAYDNSEIWVWVNSEAWAYDNSRVWTWGTVMALDKSTVKAWGNSNVYARGNSVVWAYDNSRAITNEYSTVCADDNSDVHRYASTVTVIRESEAVTVIDKFEVK